MNLDSYEYLYWQEVKSYTENTKNVLVYTWKHWILPTDG